ncbi:hypothetical protein GCM10007972_01750 [Iodidimonas muriae]|uniref:ORC1/DEAH AAA+ ATPase domain-containing protein n=1 Tax=Iodidimonas muriae TaxID=261467 RepID=A0ABQ2L682_9PROT|nr:AAA family ATPase [Iodidimonas muriae]GER06471.1 hypothetical protein JCM17843_07810 [Kordiimonadales bacterium JCM 17843]GGO04894.1 hypothetical protein GCM10007972_01750 [Iodidimonas muriae]
MYLEYYGFDRPPFQITPDVNFFFDSSVHKRALATITYGLSKLEGFVIVTGDVGAGKTTLIEYLLSHGDLKNIVVARISTTQLEAENLLELIASELELRKSGATKAAYLRDLNSYFLRIAQAGKSVLLIVDEVQNLSAGALEELRMLSNFQNRERPLVQQLLVGQPEFRARLASPACEQIRQRVIASYHLSSLTAAEVPVYIEHRLHQAGRSVAGPFTKGAYQRIHRETGGVPRKINRLCDRLLLYGFLEECPEIDGTVVDRVTAEMRAENLIDSPAPIDTDDGIDEPLDLNDAHRITDENAAKQVTPRADQNPQAAPEIVPEMPQAVPHPPMEVVMPNPKPLLDTMARLRRELDAHKAHIARLQARLESESGKRGAA